MKEYKVITQNDKWFSGKFDGQLLQKIINDHARAGWTVKSMCSASREGVLLGGSKDELIVLLERRVPKPPSAPVPSVKTNHAPPPSQADLSDAARRRAELDKVLAQIEATDDAPEEKRRQKLKAIADYC